MSILDTRQPSFITFREIFLNKVKEVTAMDQLDPFSDWIKVGSKETRVSILHELKRILDQKYEVETLIEDKLIDSEGSIESVANEMHHIFSTMYIVEKINAKCLKRK